MLEFLPGAVRSLCKTVSSLCCSKIILVMLRAETESRETRKEAIVTPQDGFERWLAVVLEENGHIWEMGWAGFGVWRGELRKVSSKMLGFLAQAAKD